MSASDLEWTIVRPPRLTDRPVRGRYRGRRDGNVRWRYSIRHADLAHVLLDAVEDCTTIRQCIAVAHWTGTTNEWMERKLDTRSDVKLAFHRAQ